MPKPEKARFDGWQALVEHLRRHYGPNGRIRHGAAGRADNYCVECGELVVLLRMGYR
jgi:hypothetical protein